MVPFSGSLNLRGCMIMGPLKKDPHCDNLRIAFSIIFSISWPLLTTSSRLQGFLWDQAPGSTYPTLQWEGRGGQEEVAVAEVVRVGVEGGGALVGVVVGRTVQSPSTTLNVVCGVVIEKVGFFKSLVFPCHGPKQAQTRNTKPESQTLSPETKRCVIKCVVRRCGTVLVPHKPVICNRIFSCQGTIAAPLPPKQRQGISNRRKDVKPASEDVEQVF